MPSRRQSEHDKEVLKVVALRKRKQQWSVQRNHVQLFANNPSLISNGVQHKIVLCEKKELTEGQYAFYATIQKKIVNIQHSMNVKHV